MVVGVIGLWIFYFIFVSDLWNILVWGTVGYVSWGEWVHPGSVGFAAAQGNNLFFAPLSIQLKTLKKKTLKRLQDLFPSLCLSLIA